MGRGGQGIFMCEGIRSRFSILAGWLGRSPRSAENPFHHGSRVHNNYDARYCNFHAP